MSGNMKRAFFGMRTLLLKRMIRRKTWMNVDRDWNVEATGGRRGTGGRCSSLAIFSQEREPGAGPKGCPQKRKKEAKPWTKKTKNSQPLQ